MRKSTRIGKRLIALFLVLLLSIESFAATVGDNDGAAFITKAEFDSLKSTFQSQIDQYNTSLDNKIDGAIASYLAGVKVAKQTRLVDLLADAKKNNIANVSFVQWEAPATAKDVVDATASLFWKIENRSSRIETSQRRDWEVFGFTSLSNGNVWGGGPQWARYHNYTETTSNFDSSYYLVEFTFGKKNFDTLKTEENDTDFILNNTNRQRCTFTLMSFDSRMNDSAYIRWNPNDITAQQWTTLPRNVLVDFSDSSKDYSRGPALQQTTYFAFAFMGVQPYNSISHAWGAYTDTGRGNKKLDYMTAGVTSGTSKGIDFNFRDSYVTDNQVTVPIAMFPPSNAKAGGQSGYWTATTFWNVNDPDAKGQTYIYNWLPEGGSLYDNNVEMKWKWNRQKIYDIDWTKLTHKYYNEKYTEPYYKFQGIPICRTVNQPGKLKLKLKFTNKVLTTGATVAPSTAPYTYVIMDKKFKNGNLPTMTETDSYYKDTDGYNHVLRREGRNTGTAEWTTDWIEIEKSKVTDTDNGDYIYIKVSPNNADQVVSVEVVDSITYTED